MSEAFLLDAADCRVDESPRATWRDDDDAPLVRRAIRVAGGACAIAGLVLFADLALHPFGALGRAYFVMTMAIAAAFAGAVFALRAIGVAAAGWRRTTGWIGTSIAFAGAMMWFAAFALLLADPSLMFTQQLTPLGSFAMAVGMLVLGVAVIASRRVAGLVRVAGIVVGTYFPLQLVVQLAFFLGPHDATPGPNGVLLGAWGFAWAALGLVLMRAGAAR